MTHPPLPAGHWWACQHPERRVELGLTLVRPGCRACEVYKQAIEIMHDGEWQPHPLLIFGQASSS